MLLTPLSHNAITIIITSVYQVIINNSECELLFNMPSHILHTLHQKSLLISDIHVTSTHYKVNNNFLSTFSALLRSWRNPHDCDSYQVLVVSWGVLGRLREILGLHLV